jgi:DNA-binding MurR/RpiR family transcriptional regulator
LPSSTHANHTISGRRSVHEALKQKILTAFEGLPKNQQRVATAVLHSAGELPFMTTDQLARKLEVSKATIVRFAQRLGYRGFSELQNELSGALQSDLASVYQFAGSMEQRQKTKDAVQLVAEMELENIHETLRHLDRKVLNTIIRRLMRARHVYTMGVGMSSVIAQAMAYGLSQAAVDARALSGGHGRFIEQLAFAKRNDVVIGFSFPPYSRETVDAAAFARKRGAAVIAITDALTAPIAFEATAVIVVRSKNALYTNSIAAFSMIINAITTGIAFRNRAAVSSVVQQVAVSMEESGEYVRTHSPDERRALRRRPAKIVPLETR